MSLLSPADIAAMNATLADFSATPLTDIDGLPIVNARLLSVAGGGVTEHYDPPAGAGPTVCARLWSATAGACTEDYDQQAGAGPRSGTAETRAYLSREAILASPATRQSVQTGLDELVRPRLTFDSAAPDVDRGD